MTKSKRGRYTLEFKQEAARLVESGQSQAAAARSLGVVEQTLGNWVRLEKIDRGLFDAAADLYSPFAATFRKVILPLSLPGVFAGTLLTFIPATGDFINERLLGNPNTGVIGDVVQNAFLGRNDYPTAAAISFVLMAIITAAVLVYAKFLGTDDIV